MSREIKKILNKHSEVIIRKIVDENMGAPNTLRAISECEIVEEFTHNILENNIGNTVWYGEILNYIYIYITFLYNICYLIN